MTQDPFGDMPPLGTPATAARTAAAEDSPDPEAAAAVAEFFSTLDKTLRARRLYQANNPVYHGFLSAFDAATTRLWGIVQPLQVAVEEHGFRWLDRTFPCGDGREALPFVFFKDGVRFLTFLPGFEHEVERFLDVLYQARLLDQRSDDDIVTLLWQAQFANFQYSYIDALAEGLQVPEGSSLTRAGEPLTTVGGPAAAEPPPPAVQQGLAPVAQLVSRADFSETLYFLDHRELQLLKREVELELARDVRADVLSALFDRLAEPLPERQSEILGILRQLLPTFLGSGDLGHATRLLTELNGVLDSGVLGAAERSAAEAIYRELSDPVVLAQLLRAMEQGSIETTGEDLGAFLGHLGPPALPLLLQGIEATSALWLQEHLRHATQLLAERHPAQLIAMLRSESPEVVRGAARLVARMGLAEAVPSLLELVRNAPVELRRAAVETLAQLRSSAALEGLRPALQDDDREVRIAAVRGLAAAKYLPARAAVEAVVAGKAIRDADLTEQMAFFEAFGAMAGAEHVPLLDRLLNGRRLFGRHTPELRACAAMALGRMSAPAARSALQKAATDPSPIVRNAIGKALRGESPAP